MEGKKQINVDPQYFFQEPDLPLEYEEDEVDCTLQDDDMENEILDDLGLKNNDSVEKVLNQPEMAQQKNRQYFNKIINDAKTRRNQLKGYKAAITKQFKRGSISEAARQMENKRIDNARVTLNAYIKHYENKVKTMKGYGLRKKHIGGNVIFFNNPKQLLKKLELIIGEILAGNNSVKMRNTRVAILDTLLKASTSNKSQYDKMYKKYFKI